MLTFFYLKVIVEQDEYFATDKKADEISISRSFMSSSYAQSVFHVGLKATNGKGVSATNIGFLKLNKAPENGTCSIEPREGVAIVTQFEALCEGWVDPEDPETGIKQLVFSGMNEFFLLCLLFSKVYFHSKRFLLRQLN